ncbi:zinc finger CCHC domain-containing protein 2-like isoform X2 [Mya arenaria]|uniref:zinc finger CCHC domain-containing protein 2-like isoform X2 n=1 Tax=Mya arenaria TaxID=6604 RepID=UPI0022E26C1C|nr:zinc finger CCHC domain-containing protein 2-like isoform X2 [Mya arenaria]
MVCKEDLCNWFKQLSPHKRIDYMCGILDMCLPFELRFLGSCVEDLAKKDFSHLREQEGKANSRYDLSKFGESETDGELFRTKMAVYLALLHSSNRNCSNIIFEMLDNHMQKALTEVDGMNSDTVQKVLLVLAMAMNHPAFSYSQKMRMYDLYKMASDASERILNQETDGRLILSELCDLRSCDQGLSPMCSPNPIHLIPSPVPAMPVQQRLYPTQPPPEKVFVCDIVVKESRIRDGTKKDVEYHLQVTWSNGEKKDVYKTYQELEEFHNKLELNCKDEKQIHEKFFTIQKIQGTHNHRKENTSQLREYFGMLANLPQSIREREMFSSFFKMSDASTSPFLQEPSVQQFTNSGGDPSVIADYTGQPMPVYPAYLSQSPVNGDVCSLSPHSPAHDLTYQANTNSFTLPGVKPGSSLTSSPCRSRASSLDSYSHSPPASPTPTDQAEINHVMKNDDLKPYLKKLTGFSHEELYSMGPEVYGRHGVPFEISEKIKSYISTWLKLRENTSTQSVPNGVNPVVTPHTPFQPPPNHPGSMAGGHYMPPPSFPYPHQGLPGQVPHPPVLSSMSANAPPTMYSFPPHFAATAGLGGGVGDLSPSNSEYSSPSQSPQLPHAVLRKKSQLQNQPSSETSSDDDKRDGQYRGKGKNHSAPSSARYGRADKQTHFSGPIHIVSGGTEEQGALPGKSGYNSDPTFNGRHKAQPAHTNVVLPQKSVIQMPENSFNPHGMQFGPRYMNLYPRPHFFPMVVNGGSRPMFTTGLVNSNSSNPTANQSQAGLNGIPGGFSNVQGGNSVNGPPVSVVNSKMFQGGAGILAPAPVAQSQAMVAESAGALLNGIDNNSQSSQPQISAEWDNLAAAAPPQHRPQVMGSTSTMTASVSHSCPSPTVATSRAPCNACGGTGQNGQQQQVIHNLQYMQHSFVPHHQPLGHGHGASIVPFQGYFPIPHHHYLNGMNPDLMYNPMMANPFHGNQPMGNVPTMLSGFSCYNNLQPRGGYSQKRPKKLNCHNCGSSKHTAADCNEGSMEAMSGQSMYNYRPKNDSD